MSPGTIAWRAGAWGARSLWALALMLLPAFAAAGDVSVTIDPTPGTCRVQGGFHCATPAAVAWDVLTDYDHIQDFVPSMISSRSERAADGHLRVLQTARGDLFIFHRRMHVALEIEEEPGRRIGFRDVLARDFEHYAGEWLIEPDSAGTKVTYTLEARPRSAIPDRMVRGMLRKATKNLLSQVRAEMTRRATPRHGAD